MMSKTAWVLLLLMAAPALMLNMSFLDSFSSSIQMIQYLNSAVKKDVKVQNSTTSATAHLMTSILKLMSLNDTKLAAAAVNALIFLAQLVSKILSYCLK